jgi:type IV secretory pathway TraG/TraD family ATPase VirD4
MNPAAQRGLAAIAVFGAVLAFFMKVPVASVVFLLFAGVQIFLSFDPSVAMGGGRYVLNILGVTWTLDDVMAHIIVVGRSGCGKTASIFRTILIQFSRNIPKWGGVMIDEKGDLYHIVVKIFAALKILPRLTLIRVPLPQEKGEPEYRMNLVGDRSLPWETHAQLVIDVAVSQGQKSTNPFFKTQGRPTITAIFESLDAAGFPVTLELAYNFISSESDRMLVLEKLQIDASPRAMQLVGFWQNFEKKGPDERSGIMSTTQNYLQPYSNPAIAAIFCSQEPNLDFSVVDEGRVLMPSVPQLYLFARGYIYAYFKLIFVYQGLRRYDIYDQEQMRSVMPRFLIIDEAQNTLLGSEEGLADHKAADRLRGARCGLVYLMQSYSSAYPNIQDEHKVNTIFANMGTHIVCALKDPPGREFASKMFGEFERKKVTKTHSSADTSTSVTTEDRPIRRASFFLNLKKFEAVIGHVEGKTAHGFVPPLTDDGTRVAPWYRFRLFRGAF